MNKNCAGFLYPFFDQIIWVCLSIDSTFERILDSLVRTSMRKNPSTVSPSEPVSSLSFKMIRENIGAVIVIERTSPVGIITEKDILERVIVPGLDVYKTPARDIMSKPVKSIEANQTIREALELMREHNIRRLVVLESGSLIGIITERRLLESVCNLMI